MKLVLLVVLMVPSYMVGGDERSCVERLGVDHRSTFFYLSKTGNYLRLEEGQHRYLAGSLVRVNGDLILGLTGLSWPHASIRSAIEQRVDCPPDTWEHLWSGELNFRQVNGHLWLTSINETSGDYAQFWMPLNQKNDLAYVVGALEPFLSHDSGTRLHSAHFRHSVERDRLHLFPVTEEYRKSFERMKANRGLPSNLTLRHFLLNNLSAIFLLGEFYKHHEGLSPGAVPQLLDAKLRREFSHSSLSLFLAWLENDGVKDPSLAGMQRELDSWRRGEIKTLEDWKALTGAFREAGSFVSRRSPRVDLIRLPLPIQGSESGR